MTERTPHPPDDRDTDADRPSGPVGGLPTRYRATVGRRPTTGAGRAPEGPR